MICFPNAKINLGLFIIGKRQDGYHDLQSLMIPSGPFDILEFAESEKDELITSGKALDIEIGDNIIIKALELLRKDFNIPQLKIHLHKNIPSGSGLGGGSSDAAFMIKHLNETFNLGISREGLINYALSVGSDCPFFISNQPSYVSGRGEKILFTEDLSDSFYLQLFNPGIHISTFEAFAGIIPQKPKKDLTEIIISGVGNWKEFLLNDFEKTVFPLHPVLSEIKENLYAEGAVYASMSGSGSSVYGLFRTKTPVNKALLPMLIWEGSFTLKSKY
jgi:4-diphosphocytidyl-2-C-methyl-D-erythritol kinase